MVKFQTAHIKYKKEVYKMKEILLATIAGMLVGVLFKFLKLPLPAPPVFSAVMGVVGVWFGGMIVEYITRMMQQ
jgi:XapX domain-containing protein